MAKSVVITFQNVMQVCIAHLAMQHARELCIKVSASVNWDCYFPKPWVLIRVGKKMW